MSSRSKQRFNDFINRRDYSTIPALPMIVGDHAAFISMVPLDQVCKSGKKLAEVLIHSFEIYQHDLLIVFSDVYVEAEAMGTKLQFSESVLPTVVEYPEPVKISPKNPEKDGRMPVILEAAEICSDHAGDEVQVCVGVKDPFSLAAQLQPPQNFFRNLIKNPDQIKALLELTAQNQKSYIDEILKLGLFPFIGAPLSSGSLISIRQFNQFVTPYLSPLIEQVQEAKLPACLHICGDSEILIDELMTLNLDILSVDQLDLAKYATRFKDKVLFMGNLSTTVLLNEKPDSVAAATNHLLNSVKNPFLPSTGCDVPMHTPVENVKAMIKTIRNTNKLFISKYND